MTNREYRIYRRWKEIKATKEKVGVVLREFGVSRSYLYSLISRIEKGDIAKIKKCLKNGHLNCFWLFKYQSRYLCLPKNRKDSTITELKKIIKEMKKDKFSIAKITELIGKERSTIIHHLQ